VLHQTTLPRSVQQPIRHAVLKKFVQSLKQLTAKCFARQETAPDPVKKQTLPLRTAFA
jgi:hypothetical protein